MGDKRISKELLNWASCNLQEYRVFLISERVSISEQWKSLLDELTAIRDAEPERCVWTDHGLDKETGCGTLFHFRRKPHEADYHMCPKCGKTIETKSEGE